MTEVARIEANAPAALTPVNGTPSPTSLIVWAEEARQAAQIAKSLAQTSFVPASLRNKPEDITAAILAGQELGLRPMASLRSLDVIQGTPALRAHAMRGLVQSKGHSVQLLTSTSELCRMRGRRRGEEEWQEVEWTIPRATGLGLTSKPEWKKQPQTMLVARATGEICRLIAADALYAMPYAAEELDGWTTPSSRAARAKPATTVTAAEITGSAPTDPEPAERDDAEAGPAEPTPEDIAAMNAEADSQ